MKLNLILRDCRFIASLGTAKFKCEYIECMSSIVACEPLTSVTGVHNLQCLDSQDPNYSTLERKGESVQIIVDFSLILLSLFRCLPRLVGPTQKNLCKTKYRNWRDITVI